MKKIVISVIGAAIVYVCASYATGYWGEKAVMHQMQFAKDEVSANALNFEIANYRRGIFTSDVDIVVNNTNPVVSKVHVKSHMKLYHGPLLFVHGFAVGLFSSTQTIQITTGDEAIDKKLLAMFGPSIGEVDSTTYFNQTYKANWTLGAVDYQDSTSHFSMANARMDMQGSYKTISGDVTIHIGEMKSHSNQSGDVTVSPIDAQVNMTNIEQGVDISNWHLAVDEIGIKTLTGASATITKIAFDQAQKVVNGGIDTAMKFSIGKVTGPVEMNNAYYTVALNQLSIEGLKALHTELTQAQAAMTATNAMPTQQQGYAYLAAYKKAIPLLLQPGLSATVEVGATVRDVNPRFHWVASYRPLPDGKILSDLREPIEYLQLIDSEAHIKLPKALATGMPIAKFLGSYITEDESEYLIDATLKEGVLVIGNTTIPPETINNFFVALSHPRVEAPKQP